MTELIMLVLAAAVAAAVIGFGVYVCYALSRANEQLAKAIVILDQISGNQAVSRVELQALRANVSHPFPHADNDPAIATAKWAGETA